MTDETLKTAYQLYTDLWKLVKEHHNARTDAEWQALADNADELVGKYGEDKRQLVLDTLELIERNSKK